MRMIRAFLWGGAIGALLGLLFAPQRGEETRSQLQARLNEWQGQAQTQIDTLRSRSTSVIEQGRQAVNTGLGQAQRATNQAADAAKENVSRTGTTNY
jgi:gas vesicle protein